MGALSSKYNSNPEKSSRAYDSDRDGAISLREVQNFMDKSNLHKNKPNLHHFLNLK